MSLRLLLTTVHSVVRFQSVHYCYMESKRYLQVTIAFKMEVFLCPFFDWSPSVNWCSHLVKTKGIRFHLSKVKKLSTFLWIIFHSTRFINFEVLLICLLKLQLMMELKLNSVECQNYFVPRTSKIGELWPYVYAVQFYLLHPNFLANRKKYPFPTMKNYL